MSNMSEAKPTEAEAKRNCKIPSNSQLSLIRFQQSKRYFLFIIESTNLRQVHGNPIGYRQGTTTAKYERMVYLM